MDNLQLEWICTSIEDEKLAITTDMSYPAINADSLSKLYLYEESTSKRFTIIHNHKKIINMLFEFFYMSNCYLTNVRFLDKVSSFARKDEEIKEKMRCQICNYILGDLDTLFCQECGKYYHFQCLWNHQNLPIKTSEIYIDWICKDCSFCQICYNKSKKDSMVTISKKILKKYIYSI